MAMLNDSESSEDDSKEEKVNIALMASTEASESDSYTKEVFSHLTLSKHKLFLFEILEKSQKLQKRYKIWNRFM